MLKECRRRDPAVGQARASRDSIDPALMRRAERLAAAEISFVDHPSFRRRTSSPDFLPSSKTPSPLSKSSAIQTMAFLPEMVRSDLLSFKDEQTHFLEMNFHRYRAERLRRKLKLRNPDPSLMDEIEEHLDAARQIRDTIAKANLRLVVGVAKKLCHSLDDLGELVGEGVLPLLRAVDLFDAGRGFRFSTYATWAVRNQLIRVLSRQRSQSRVMFLQGETAWLEVPDHRAAVSHDLPSKKQAKEWVSRFMEALPERERQIVCARFGLEGEPGGQSLAQISKTVGLSKERIRQIVVKALKTLHQQFATAGYNDVDTILGTA